MTDPDETSDAREADGLGERPDLGRTPDAMIDRLSGTDSGSDTRAGSLQGGVATGSDDDPDSDIINAALAREGRASAAQKSEPPIDPEAVENTGVGPGELTDGEPGEDADAATG